MEWYLEPWRKFAQFTGRARRREYWTFALVNTLIIVVLSIIEGNAGTLGILSGIFVLAMLIPSLAVSVRRLHDTNKSGWWLFIQLIPLVGAIILLVFMLIEGDREANKYGPDPKAAVA